MQIYKVSQITRYIKELFDIDDLLQDLWLEGEVSNFSQSTAGHIYFTLKDEEAQIRCVLWRSQAALQSHLPQDGEAVIAHGHVSVYETQGTYQFYIDTVQPVGVGLLYLEFEALKSRLEAEGLFALEHKRSLPPFPRRLGVVTSPVGAAIQDILNVLGRRYPLVEVILAPTPVQGDEAPDGIVAALDALARYGDIDAIIVARGGGTLEELWAFNDERVARAIYASPVPVISGIGHETDFTIADFVADLRAPTPSAAAEVAVPDQQELRSSIEIGQQRLGQAMRGRIAQWRGRLGDQQSALRRLSPRAMVEGYRQRLDDLTGKALSHLRHRLSMQRERLRGCVLQLQALSPTLTLARGYSITRQLATKQIVKSVAQVSAGDAIEVQVSDGKFGGVVS